MGDIEIARSVKLDNITKVAEKIGIDEEYLENYGKYKAKVSDKIMQKRGKNYNINRTS